MENYIMSFKDKIVKIIESN